MENDGVARLRFGDNVMGQRPSGSAVAQSSLADAVASDDIRFRATYRVGSGEAGNVGAGSIAHLVMDPGLVDPGFLEARVNGDGLKLDHLLRLGGGGKAKGKGGCGQSESCHVWFLSCCCARSRARVF